MKRREIWNSLGGNKQFSPYAAGALMPEKDITLLSSKSMSITTPEHVPKVLGLGSLSYKYISLAHQQLWGYAFDIISSTLREPSFNTAETPPLPPNLPNPTLGPLPSSVLQEVSHNKEGRDRNNMLREGGKGRHKGFQDRRWLSV